MNRSEDMRLYRGQDCSCCDSRKVRVFRSAAKGDYLVVLCPACDMLGDH